MDGTTLLYVLININVPLKAMLIKAVNRNSDTRIWLMSTKEEVISFIKRREGKKGITTQLVFISTQKRALGDIQI